MIRYLDVNICFYFSLFHQTNIVGQFFFLLNDIFGHLLLILCDNI